MSAWKVLLIVVLACASLGLALATVVIPLAETGADRWVWLGGLLSATVATGGLLGLFLRHAGKSLDVPPRWAARHMAKR